MRSRFRPNHATVVAYIALFVALGGTTYAATGGNFILGKSNSATTATSLSAPVAGNTLKLTNAGTGPGAAALGLNVASGHPPFTVNSGTKVVNLNADKLDGLDSTKLVDNCPSATSKFGQICARSDGALKPFGDAVDQCAGLGLRMLSLSEAITLAKNYDVPGVDAGQYFWTDDVYNNGTVDSVVVVSEEGNRLSITTGSHQAVCVADPSN